MNKYEVMFIVKPGEEEEVNKVVTKVEELIAKNEGTVEKVERMGKRRLAYEVKDFMDGVYVLMYFDAPPAAIAELDRVMKITDEILKHMIIKEEE